MSDQPEVVLWQTVRGERCTLVRREVDPKFEVTVSCGADIVSQQTFEGDPEAAEFAIAALHTATKANHD